MVVIWWILVLVALVVAILIGETVHLRRRSSATQLRLHAALKKHGGFRIDLLAGSALTLAVVMCSFMLAVSYSSFDQAAQQATAEAGAVASLYETSGLMPAEKDARLLQEETICYARSIVSDEWPELGESTTVSARVELWRTRLQQSIRSLSAVADPTPVLSAVREADQARTTTHQVRLVASGRTAPWYLFTLLIVVCAAALFLVTAFTVRTIPRRLRLPLVGVLTLLLGGTLAVIVDLGHPYNGVSNIGPEYLAQVVANSTENFADLWNGASVDLCDANGLPRT